MKLPIFAVLAVSLFQMNLAVADQYVYADDEDDYDYGYVYADLVEPTTEVINSTDNTEPYVYADDHDYDYGYVYADLVEPTTEVTSRW